MNFKHIFRAGFLTVLMTTGLCSSILEAQSLYVLKSNKVQDTYANADIKSLSFDGGNLVIVQNDGNVEQITLNDIARMSFKEYATVPTRFEEVEITSLNNLKCYPNPTENELHIEMQESESEVSVEVVTTSGQVVFSNTQYYTNSLISLNVAALESGMYILRIRNAQEIQTTSFIKQ